MPSRGSSPRTASSTPSTGPSPAEQRREESGKQETAPSGSPQLRGVRAWLPHYPFRSARADFQAGLTVAAISLPQSMAYALIAGVDPRFGLFTAVICTALGSIFGSSSHLIIGPTGAVSLVVFSTLSFFDPEARLDAYEGMFLLAAM